MLAVGCCTWLLDARSTRRCHARTRTAFSCRLQRSGTRAGGSSSSHRYAACNRWRPVARGASVKVYVMLLRRHSQCRRSCLQRPDDFSHKSNPATSKTYESGSASRSRTSERVGSLLHVAEIGIRSFCSARQHGTFNLAHRRPQSTRALRSITPAFGRVVAESAVQ